MISARTRSDLARVGLAVALAVALGALYGALKHPVPAAGLVTGAATGLVVWGGLTGLEQLVFTQRPGRVLARRPLWQFLGLRLAVYLALTLAGVRLGYLAGDLLLPPQHPHGIQLSLADVTVSFLAALAFVLFTDLDRVLGGRVLLDLLLGRQLKPYAETRVFLLADVVGSTEWAKRLGDLRFHALLNDLFVELAEPVARHGGTICRYVGDQVIVSWPASGGARRRALRCTLAIQRVLRELAPRYRAAYGVAPEMRIALHAGPVVAGEMGHLRREVVYLGETLNAATKLERFAARRDRRLVMSQAMLADGGPPGALPIQRLASGAEVGAPDLGAVYAVEPVPNCDALHEEVRDNPTRPTAQAL